MRKSNTYIILTIGILLLAACGPTTKPGQKQARKSKSSKSVETASSSKSSDANSDSAIKPEQIAGAYLSCGSMNNTEIGCGLYDKNSKSLIFAADQNSNHNIKWGIRSEISPSKLKQAIPIIGRMFGLPTKSAIDWSEVKSIETKTPPQQSANLFSHVLTRPNQFRSIEAEVCEKSSSSSGGECFQFSLHKKMIEIMPADRSSKWEPPAPNCQDKRSETLCESVLQEELQTIMQSVDGKRLAEQSGIPVQNTDGATTTNSTLLPEDQQALIIAVMKILKQYAEQD